MAEQETLHGGNKHHPLEHGLWARFKDGEFRINHAAWMRACAAGEFVGTCRLCGDYLIPKPPFEVGNRTDYEATCRRGLDVTLEDGKRVAVAGCEWTLNAPGGRVLARSSRHSEMPPGWWERRERELKKGDG